MAKQCAACPHFGAQHTRNGPCWGNGCGCKVYTKGPGTPTMSKGHKFGDECGAVPCEKLADHEDKVSWIIKTLHADELQLLYHYLYNLGYRDSHAAAATGR